MNLHLGQRETVSLAPLNPEPKSQDMEQAIYNAILSIDNLD